MLGTTWLFVRRRVGNWLWTSREEKVRFIIWWILSCVDFFVSCSVEMKSENSFDILLFFYQQKAVRKICSPRCGWELPPITLQPSLEDAVRIEMYSFPTLTILYLLYDVYWIWPWHLDLYWQDAEEKEPSQSAEEDPVHQPESLIAKLFDLSLCLSFCPLLTLTD